jgi:hypothetical protein
MARIPLIVSESYLTVKATVMAPGVSRVEPIKMIVDTGSSSVVLSQKDAELLGMRVKDLPRSEVCRIGYGGRMDTAVVTNVLVSLRDADGRAVSIPLDRVLVNRASSLKKQEERLVYAIPSVLGTEVLRAGDLALYAHMNKRTAFLERA